MDGTFMEANVEKVILAVYQPGADENERREALLQLQAFSTRPEAWGVLIALLQSRIKEVQFYSSIMLYAKVQKEWSRQTDSAKEDIYNRSSAVVQRFVRSNEACADAEALPCLLDRNAMQRLCLMLARIVVQAPQVLEGFVNAAGRFIAIGLGTSRYENDASLDAAARDRALYVGIQLLMDLPEERGSVLSGHSDGSGIDIGDSGEYSYVNSAGTSKSSLINSGVSSLDPEGIDAKLVDMAPRVMEIVMLIMQNQSCATHHTRALDCLQRWVPVTIDLFTLSRYGLLRPILNALRGCQDVNVVEAASRALETCVKKNSHERDVGQPESERSVCAFNETVDALLAAASRLNLNNGNASEGINLGKNNSNLSLSVYSDEDESIALSLCRVTIAVAEHELDRIVAGENTQLLSLVDLVMALTAHQSLNVAIHTLNFWLLLQDYPVLERHVSLREPRYQDLLAVLLRQSRLTAVAASGSEQDVEYDCQSFRDGGDGVKEPLVVVLYVLGPQFLDTIYAALTASQDPSEWQCFEAALFALAAVSQELVSQHQSGASGGPRTAATCERLLAVLKVLPSLPLLRTNGATLKAAMQCLGAYAKILAGMEHSLIEHALECVVFALTFGVECVSKAAGVAFQRVCHVCRLQLAMHPDGVKQLAMAMNNAVFNNDATADTNMGAPRSRVVPVSACSDCIQGFARIASCMKLEQCTETLAIMLNPVFERLRFAVGAGDRGDVADKLCMLCTAVKFIDLPSGTLSSPTSQHPVAGILQGTLPILEQIYATPALQSDPDVVDMLYTLISTSFVSARDVLAPHLESLLQSAVRQFRASWSPCCIACVGKAVEIYQSPNDQSGFVTLFGMLTAAMVDAVREGHTAENPEITTAYFDTALLFLLFCPDALFSQQINRGASDSDGGGGGKSDGLTAGTVLLIVTQAVCSDESTSVRSLLVFLSTLIAKVNDGPLGSSTDSNSLLARFKLALEQVFHQTGAMLVRNMLLGIAGTTSPAQVSKLASCMGDLAYHYPGAMQGWVYSALVAEPAAFARLTDANKQALVAIIAELHLSRMKARDVFLQVCKVCRQTEGFGPNEMQKFLREVHAALATIAIVNASPPRFMCSSNDDARTASPVIDISFLD